MKLYNGQNADVINYTAGKYGVDSNLLGAIIEAQNEIQEKSQHNHCQYTKTITAKEIKIGSGDNVSTFKFDENGLVINAEIIEIKPASGDVKWLETPMIVFENGTLKIEKELIKVNNPEPPNTYDVKVKLHKGELILPADELKKALTEQTNLI